MAVARSGFSKHDLGMLVVALIWGANFSANKFALREMPPVVFAATRFIAASVIMITVVRVVRPGRPIPAREAWLLAGLGVIGNTCYQAAFMTGLVTTTAINASLILGALPTVVAVLGTVFGVERSAPRLWWGIVIATAGVAVVIAVKGIHFTVEGLRGDLLILFACACWAAFTVGVRHVGRGLDPLRVTALTILGGTPGLVLLAARDLRVMDWGALSAGGWFALVFSSVFAIVIAYVIWSYAVQGIGGNRTAIYNCVTPIFAAGTAAIVLGERLVPAQGLGAALVFAGVFLSQGARSDP